MTPAPSASERTDTERLRVYCPDHLYSITELVGEIEMPNDDPKRDHYTVRRMWKCDEGSHDFWTVVFRRKPEAAP
jgi:hypothetical protein